MISQTYKAGWDIGRTKYHLRRLNYMNTLSWDTETEYLNVEVNGTEVEFNLWNNGSLVELIRQPEIGDTVQLKVEQITFLD